MKTVSNLILVSIPNIKYPNIIKCLKVHWQDLLQAACVPLCSSRQFSSLSSPTTHLLLCCICFVWSGGQTGSLNWAALKITTQRNVFVFNLNNLFHLVHHAPPHQKSCLDANRGDGTRITSNKGHTNGLSWKTTFTDHGQCDILQYSWLL